MKKQYDFTNSRPNPYAEKIKKPITIRLDVDTVDYFKSESMRTGIPYQNLINLYLGECARKQKRVSVG